MMARATPTVFMSQLGTEGCDRATAAYAPTPTRRWSRPGDTYDPPHVFRLM